MFQGLRSITEYIEYYDTGGGLSRPLFAAFLSQAGDTLSDKKLVALSGRYATLGAQWSALAEAALPDDIPVFKQAKALLADQVLAGDCRHGSGDARWLPVERCRER